MAGGIHRCEHLRHLSVWVCVSVCVRARVCVCVFLCLPPDEIQRLITKILHARETELNNPLEIISILIIGTIIFFLLSCGDVRILYLNESLCSMEVRSRCWQTWHPLHPASDILLHACEQNSANLRRMLNSLDYFE